jgi:hypothetical protein
MKIKSKLIYQSVNTCFQTFLPVFFYGLPIGKMLVIFARFKTENPLDTQQEWVVAQHLDYSFNYPEDKIYTHGNQEISLEEFIELADNLEQRIRPLKIYGNFYSNNEAMHFLIRNKDLMLYKTKTVEFKVDAYLSAIEI